MTTGASHAFDFPGFVPLTSARSSAAASPFRKAALSGDPRTSTTDARVKELDPDDPHLHRWLDTARERIASRARRGSAGPGPAPPLGLAFKKMVEARVSRRSSSARPSTAACVASPNREIEA
jgi:urocanate hydratase